MDSNTSIGVPARSGFGLFIPPQKKGEEEFLVCFFSLFDDREIQRDLFLLTQETQSWKQFLKVRTSEP